MEQKFRDYDYTYGSKRFVRLMHRMKFVANIFAQEFPNFKFCLTIQLFSEFHIVDFSHWLTYNLPFDDSIRISLLELDCPVVRLRRQLDFMRKVSIIVFWARFILVYVSYNQFNYLWVPIILLCITGLHHQK